MVHGRYVLRPLARAERKDRMSQGAVKQPSRITCLRAMMGTMALFDPAERVTEVFASERTTIHYDSTTGRYKVEEARGVAWVPQNFVVAVEVAQ